MADIGTIMNAMRDPAGVPGNPVLFQVLMVVTWSLHIAFVNLTLGASGLSIYAFYKRSEPHWMRLSIALTQVAKIGVSLLIVLGVAPLLFTQTIYDPQWYASNVLSGRWAIAFILTLVVAYCCWFAFYYANREGAKKHIGLYAWIAFALFCLDGLIMHALSYQEILPGQWMRWYAPGGAVDTRGAALHAIQWPRYVFIMSLGLPAVGVFLIAYARYFAPRADREPKYLDFVRATGQRLASRGYAVALVPMLAWQFVQPAASGLAWHPVGWALAAALLAMSVWTARLDAAARGYLPAAAGLAVLALLALWREVIRAASLKHFGYEIGDYPVHADWPSTLLFFATLIGVGGPVGGFYLALLYRAGRVQGTYQADRGVSRLGSAAIAVLGLWIAVFFIYGIVVWVRNSVH
jgi:hypothetical protein